MIRCLVATATFSLPILLAANPVFADQTDSAFSGRYDNPEDVFVLGDYIRKASDDGQYDQAISSIEEHLVRFAEDGRARLAVAKLYANVGSWDLAREQASAALDSGQLSAEEAREAEALSRRASTAANGLEWFVDVGGGFKVTVIDAAAPILNWKDRTTTGAYGDISGAARIDLGTALGDTIVLSGNFGAVYDYQDAYQGLGPVFGLQRGKNFTSTHARISATYDMGLPVTSFDAARLQFGVFADYATAHPDIRAQSLGGVVRAVVMPTVDTRLHAEYSYEDLSSSKGINADRRQSWEVGGSVRLAPRHSVGLAVRGFYEHSPGGTLTGRAEEVEASYASRLPYQPFDTIWTQNLSLAAGTFFAKGLPASSTSTYSGKRYRLDWTNTFHIDGKNRVEASYTLTRTDYDPYPAFFITPDRSSTIHAFSLGYVHRF